jgi:TolB-like protein/lipopolysaccharide biosynthesis regulator YciM
MNAPTTAITGAIKKHKFGAAAALLMLILVGVGLRFFVFSASDGAAVDSLAVLPFQNAADEFLGDGIAETLINNFTKIPELRVMARNSAFRFRGRDAEVQTIGKELGVKAVLTGRITQEADKISIQIDLVSAADGTQIFGNRYDGKPSELLDLQQKIVRDVSARLTKKKQQASKKYTDSAEAYEFYLRGRYLLNKRTADELKRAIQEFKQAVDRDPNFALGYVGLANGYALLEEYAGTPATETLPQAKSFAKRALELDDSIAEAHASLGFINSQAWEWTEAEQNFQRAIQLDPKLSTANHWYCGFLLQTGRIDDALKEIKRAQELDPLSSIVNVNVGMTYLAKGDTESAIRELEKLIALDPNYWTARSWLGTAYLIKGDHEKAIAELRKGTELSKQSGRALSFLGYGLAKTGKLTEATQIARELEEKYKNKEATVQNLAVVYAGLGDKDRAFEWLEKNFSEHSGELGRIRWYPQFESLRGDSRYQSLLQRMGQTP